MSNLNIYPNSNFNPNSKLNLEPQNSLSLFTWICPHNPDIILNVPTNIAIPGAHTQESSQRQSYKSHKSGFFTHREKQKHSLGNLLWYILSSTENSGYNSCLRKALISLVEESPVKKTTPPWKVNDVCWKLCTVLHCVCLTMDTWVQSSLGHMSCLSVCDCEITLPWANSSSSRW